MSTPAPSTLARTPLFERHQAAHAKLVPFAGWEMPVQYESGIRAEHMAVREGCGLFDVSHMGEIETAGPDALALLQRLLSNDVSAIPVGGAQYSVLCREDGGVLDDLFTYCLGADRYITVTNASNHVQDLEWFRAHASDFDVELHDRLHDYAMLAVQGPRARGIVQMLADAPLPPRMTAAAMRLVVPGTGGGTGIVTGKETGAVRGKETGVVTGKETGAVVRGERTGAPGGAVGGPGGIDVLVCATGYTGEDGVELLLAPDDAPALWDELVRAGATPAGLAARDTLRLEACFHLYGNDLSVQRNPIEAGLGWCCKEDTDFIGSAAVRAVRAAGPPEKLVAFTLDGPGIARQGNPVLGGGEVTSGTLSPCLGVGIGLAYVPAARSAVGTPLQIDVRGRLRPATVHSKPFVPKGV